MLIAGCLFDFIPILRHITEQADCWRSEVGVYFFTCCRLYPDPSPVRRSPGASATSMAHRRPVF